MQLCLRAGEHGGVFDDKERTWITHVVEQIRVRDPRIPVLISPLNFFGGGQVCTSVGEYAQVLRPRRPTGLPEPLLASNVARISARSSPSTSVYETTATPTAPASGSWESN